MLGGRWPLVAVPLRLNCNKIINEWGKEWCAAATVSAPGSVRRMSRWNARHGSSAQLRAARVSTGGHSCSVQSWSSECQHHCVAHRTVIRVIAVEVDTSCSGCSLSNKMWHLQGRSCDITLERKIYLSAKIILQHLSAEFTERENKFILEKVTVNEWRRSWNCKITDFNR